MESIWGSKEAIVPYVEKWRRMLWLGDKGERFRTRTARGGGGPVEFASYYSPQPNKRDASNTTPKTKSA